ncbi:MAG: hypothetical protein Tsb002_01600 [Wenzhouxiangellaceae bacterium]
MIEEAQDLYQRGDFAGAYSLYERMLADEPENHEVLFMMALCRQRQDQLPEASELLEKALLSNPRQALYHYSLGSVRLRRGQLQSALSAYGKATELNPNYAEAYVGQGYTQLIQGRYGEAESALRAALRADPRIPTAHVHLGVSLLEQGRHDEALQVLQEGAELNPDDAYTQTHLGRAFYQQRHYPFAAQCFRNALKQFADQAPLWLWLGQALVELGEDEEALQALRKSLDLGQETPEALYGLARLYLRNGQPEPALNMLQRVLRLSPQAQEVRLLAARTLRQLQRYEEALELLQPIADNDTARKMLVRLHLDRFDVEQAHAQLAALNLSGVDDLDVQLMRAEMALLQEQYAEADSLLQPILAAESVPPMALLLDVQRRYRQGDAGGALSQLDNIDSGQNSGLAAEVRDWRIRLLDATGDHDRAWSVAREGARRRSAMMAACTAEPPQEQLSDDQSEALDRDRIWSWPPRPPDDGEPEPILVYGWPGSGREPLLASLSGLRGVQVLRDAVSRQQERRNALSWPRGGDTLSQLSEADWRLQRRRYWREVRRGLPRWEKQPVIDGLWFSAAALPTIYRLFPGVRVVVLQNDEASLATDWALHGYEDVAAMLACWREEQAVLKQAMELLPLQWIVLNESELRDDAEAALTPLVQQLPGIDTETLARRMQVIAQRLALPADCVPHYAEPLAELLNN